MRWVVQQTPCSPIRYRQLAPGGKAWAFCDIVANEQTITGTAVCLSAISPSDSGGVRAVRRARYAAPPAALPRPRCTTPRPSVRRGPSRAPRPQPAPPAAQERGWRFAQLDAGGSFRRQPPLCVVISARLRRWRPSPSGAPELSPLCTPRWTSPFPAGDGRPGSGPAATIIRRREH